MHSRHNQPNRGAWPIGKNERRARIVNDHLRQYVLRQDGGVDTDGAAGDACS